jgi:hypothetical protein
MRRQRQQPPGYRTREKSTRASANGNGHGAGDGVPFTITWTSSRATRCSADFDGNTATAASVSKTEAADGIKTYNVTCTGLGGDMVGTVEVTVILPSAEGQWSGTTASNRSIAGLVTREGNYWLLYSAIGDPASAVGFYTGTGTSSAGEFPSANLREFSFEGGNIVAQGTLASTYAHPSGSYSGASTLVGSFVPPSSINHNYALTATGSQFYDASGDLSVVYNGSWNDDTGEGNLTGVGTIGLYGLSADLTQTFRMVPGGTGKGVLRQASGSTGNCLDTIGGGVCNGLVGNFKGAMYNNINYAGGANNATASATPFTVGPSGATLDWSFLVQTEQTTDSDTGEVSTFYDAYHLDVTLATQLLPPITAGAFDTHYNPQYEMTPSLSALAGSYSGAAGVVNTLAGGATLEVSSDGSVSGVAGACGYNATIDVHASGGNVYDVLSISFTGGACPYTGTSFNGVARYDADSGQVVVTATNSAQDRGFMFVGTKP